MTLTMGRMLRSPERRGNALVEFALSAGLLVPALLAVFQFGYAFFAYNRLAAAVRGGARYASVRAYDSASATPSTAYSNAVKNWVVYGNAEGTGNPLVTGLTTSNVAVSMAFVNDVPDVVTVSLASFSLTTMAKTFNLTNKPKASFRFEGRFAP